jgi:Lrp/AsnC family leucine-responsive transcriptional regulator
MDATDRTILRHLMRDGRATWADLAVEMGLTAPAIAQRVRRLQERGIIRHFAAWVAPAMLAPVSAFVEVSLGGPLPDTAFRREIEQLDAVQECHQVTGDNAYLLKVRCASLAQLGELVGTVLPRLSGGRSVRSRVILATVKESTILPVPEDAPAFALDEEIARDGDAQARSRA